jgi:hypothetical protein
VSRVERESLQADIQLNVAEAGSQGRGQFRNLDKVEHPLLEAATKQWLVEK